MKRLARHTLAVMMALVFSGHATLALAQISETDPAEDKSYSMPYLLVLLAVALGLMIVLRPSLRYREVKEKRRDL